MDLRLTSPTEHELLIFWAQLTLLLAVARGLGVLARRVGQPTVVGELAAGLVLGPSVLGKVAPGLFGELFPRDDVQSGMLFAVAWLGVVLLLVVTGFETDLELVRRQGRATGFASTGSLAIPFGGGLAVGLVMPLVFVGPGVSRSVFALFMATALSISSLPVIAKILSEMRLMRRSFAQVTLAAGMANDVVGWLLLGMIAGMATSGEVSLGLLAKSFGGMVLFLALAFTVGQRAIDLALRSLRQVGATGPAWLTVAVVVVFSFGTVTQWLRVEAVLGAFIAGILLGRSRFAHREVEEQFETVTISVFAPIFFATAGLRVDLGLLGDPTVLGWAVAVLAVATVTKIAGSVLGARLAGLGPREGLALGVGLNVRGAMQVVIATVGLSLGVLTRASYTVVVLMAMATSMMAPPMLRAVVRNWRGTTEEQERLDREEALARNILVRPTRVLLPTRGDDSSVLAAQIVHHAWPHETALTLFSAANDGEELDVGHLVAGMTDRVVEHTAVFSQEPVEAILRDARLGYGAIAVGTGQRDGDGSVISPLVDRLLVDSPVPVVIARRGAGGAGTMTGRFQRILVPVNASESSRAAEEVAFSLARKFGSPAVILHVLATAAEDDDLTAPASREDAGVLSPVLRRDRGPHVDRMLVGQGVVEASLALAGEHGLEVGSLVRDAAFPAEEIVRTAEEIGADVVVLGASVRQVGGRPFLGHNVEHVLEHTTATVVVVTAPNGWATEQK